MTRRSCIARGLVICADSEVSNEPENFDESKIFTQNPDGIGDTPTVVIPFGDAPQGAMQGPRHTIFAQLTAAKKLTDLAGKS